MSKHTVQISDDWGNSFKVVVSIGWFGNSIGTWRSLETGFIRFPFGRVEYLSDKIIPTLRHAQLYQNSQTSDGWGIRLNDYIDVFGVNDQGMGLIAPNWAVGLKPNRIAWVLVD